MNLPHICQIIVRAITCGDQKRGIKYEAVIIYIFSQIRKQFHENFEKRPKNYFENFIKNILFVHNFSKYENLNWPKMKQYTRLIGEGFERWEKVRFSY